jgi:deazaflavin-dependent oxidoreductase (nitroreductase family)
VRVTGDGSDRKRRNVRFVQRYFLNPPAKLAVRIGLVPGYVLIETTGRRTGKRRRNVVGMHVEEPVGWVVAEHGNHAGYVRNIRSNPAVRVCISGKWRTAHAEVVADDDPGARLDSFGRSVHAANVRRFGTDLLTLRFVFASSP